MASENYSIVLSSTPDPALAHKARAEEIAELVDYLQVRREFPDGTVVGVIMEDSEAARAANTDKMLAVLDTDGKLTGFKVFDNDGSWSFMQLSVDNLPDGMLTAAKLNAGTAGDGLEQNVTTKALDVKVDDDTIEISGGELRVKSGGSLGFELYPNTSVDVSKTLTTLTASGSLGTISNSEIPTGVGSVYCLCSIRRTDSAGATDGSTVRCRVTMYLKFYSGASNFFIAGSCSRELTSDSTASADATQFLTITSPVLGNVYKIEAILVADPANTGVTFTTDPAGYDAGFLNLNVYGVRAS